MQTKYHSVIETNGKLPYHCRQMPPQPARQRLPTRWNGSGVFSLVQCDPGYVLRHAGDASQVFGRPPSCAAVKQRHRVLDCLSAFCDVLSRVTTRNVSDRASNMIALLTAASPAGAVALVISSPCSSHSVSTNGADGRAAPIEGMPARISPPRPKCRPIYTPRNGARRAPLSSDRCLVSLQQSRNAGWRRSGQQEMKHPQADKEKNNRRADCVISIPWAPGWLFGHVA